MFRVLTFVLLLSALPLSCAVIPLLDFSDYQFAGEPLGLGDNPAGWVFELSRPLTITALGFWDQLPDGLSVPHRVVLWDGAPYHRAQAVRETATALDITLMPLPGYSPDLMPVEELWHWLRED